MAIDPAGSKLLQTIQGSKQSVELGRNKYLLLSNLIYASKAATKPKLEWNNNSSQEAVESRSLKYEIFSHPPKLCSTFRCK
jgi:hypothetical protein